jgi:hypothetical protein
MSDNSSLVWFVENRFQIIGVVWVAAVAGSIGLSFSHPNI